MAWNSASSTAKQQGCLLRSALSESALVPWRGFLGGKNVGTPIRYDNLPTVSTKLHILVDNFRPQNLWPEIIFGLDKNRPKC